jgi:glycine reductase
MELTQRLKYIDSIDFGELTRVKKKSLTINEHEIEKFLKSKNKEFDKVSLKIVNSKEERRIFKIFDIIEPRMKIDPPDTDYPGIISKIGNTGTGKTLVLKNIAVVLINSRNSDWKPIIEHTEQYAKCSNYASLNLICLDIRLKEKSDQTQYYRNLYLAGLQLSIFLCLKSEPENYDDELRFTNETNNAKKYKIGYFFQLCSSQYASEKSGPIFMGKAGDNFMPTCITPTMAIDGVVTRNYYEQGFDTYNIQNNSVIYSLLDDEKIDFRGIVVSTSSMNNEERARNAIVASTLFRDLMGVDAVVMTKAFGGASNLDLEKLANELAHDGIITVPIIQATSIEEKLSDALIFQTNIFRHIVCSGWTLDKVSLPINIPSLFKPEFLNLESELILEIEFIKGIIDNLGSTRIKVVEV